MINLVIIDDHEDENIMIHSAVEECMLKVIGEEQFDYMHLTKEKVDTFIDNNTKLDFCCYDVSGGIDRLYDLRRRYPLMSLLLMVEMNMSPTEYLRPGIKPDAVLIRPVNLENARDTVKNFIIEGIAQRGNNNQSFVIDRRDCKYYIPFHKIFYFESRDKKIYLKTIEGEYGFYGTIDELEEDLPYFFVRCHRSFIVNKTHIQRVLNINTIELSNGFILPISRTYRQIIKEL